MEQKISYIRASHQDHHHLGGREAVVKSLRELDISWNNMDLATAYVLRHCTHCLQNSTRDTNEPAPRHLPRPLVAGEILGVDLKKVTPPGAPAWCMLLIVDFATNRLWCHDLDDNKRLDISRGR